MYYKKAASQLELRAEYNLGLIYLQGQAGAVDYPTALAWLTHAAFKGNAYAQYALAQILENGYPNPAIVGEASIPADRTQAMAMYYLAAANHQAGAQYRLAELLVREPDVGLTVVAKQKRDALIRALYEGAVASGTQVARLPLAFYTAEEANDTQRAAIFELVQQEAFNNNPVALLLLGLLYDRGIGCVASHPKAMIWYNKAPKSPSIDFILGTYLAIGDGVSKDLARAQALLTTATAAGFYYAPLNLAVLEQQQQLPFLDNLLRAHQSGNSKASLLLADYYLAHDNNPHQAKQAREIYQHLAEQGYADAQLKLAYLLEEGTGGTQNIPQALVWYEQAAKQEQPDAQYRLGRLHQMGLITGKPDYELAQKYYAQASARFAPAAIAAGFMHETVDDNYHQALRDYSQAAEMNDAVAQFDLALMYEQGKGMAPDARRAETLYLAAANQGHVQAMVQLAGLYLSGALGARDESNALFWYQKAAEKQDRDALYQLGVLSTGAKAREFYQAATEQGHEKAMLALAKCYQYGLGVEKDTTKASTLYKTLAANGNVEASRGLQWLAAQTDSRVSFIVSLEWAGSVRRAQNSP